MKERQVFERIARAMHAHIADWLSTPWDGLTDWAKDNRICDAQRFAIAAEAFGLTAADLANIADNKAVVVPSAGAAADVLAERRRQVEAEGWSAEHDDERTDGSLATAAATYAVGAAAGQAERAVMDAHGRKGTPYHVHSLWPGSWAAEWFKPKSRRHDLVKAGALILAEIERLDRAAARPGAKEE